MLGKEINYLNFMPKSTLFGWFDNWVSGIDSCASAFGNKPPVADLEQKRSSVERKEQLPPLNEAPAVDRGSQPTYPVADYCRWSSDRRR